MISLMLENGADVTLKTRVIKYEKINNNIEKIFNCFIIISEVGVPFIMHVLLVVSKHCHYYYLIIIIMSILKQV